MKDWINRFLIMYGNSLDTILYILILMIFMYIMKQMGAY
jgi:hypothetical protein